MCSAQEFLAPLTKFTWKQRTIFFWGGDGVSPFQLSLFNDFFKSLIGVFMAWYSQYSVSFELFLIALFSYLSWIFSHPPFCLSHLTLFLFIHVFKTSFFGPFTKKQVLLRFCIFFSFFFFWFLIGCCYFEYYPWFLSLVDSFFPSSFLFRDEHELFPWHGWWIWEIH